MAFKRLDIEPLEPDARVIATVHRVFSDFEPVLIEVVTEYAIVPARLEYLLEKLELSLDGELDERLLRLREHARGHGEREFAMQIRRDLWKAIQSVERRRIQASLDALEADRKRAEPNALFTPPPSIGARTEEAMAALEAPSSETDTAPSLPPPAARADARPETRAHARADARIELTPTPAPLKTPKKQPGATEGMQDLSDWVVTQTYEGPDRRARAADRRGPYDRRGNDEGQLGDKRSREERRNRSRGRRKTD